MKTIFSIQPKVLNNRFAAMNKIKKLILMFLVIDCSFIAFGNEVEIQVTNLTPALGSASGGGNFVTGNQVVISSVPNPGYVTDWSLEYGSHIVQNGSFELPGFQEAQPFKIYVGTSNSWYFHYIDYFKNVPDLVTDGSYSVDLNRNPGDSSYVEQQLDQLLIGSEYLFSCDLRLNESARGSKARVTIGNYEYISPSIKVDAWDSVRFRWNAESQNPALRITAVPASPTSDGTFLDNVKITRVIPDIRVFSFAATENKVVIVSFVQDLRDEDNDGISNYDEVVTWGTSPNSRDSDDDGLDDYVEINTHQTNPALGDTDGDGFLDGFEFYAGHSPLNDQDKPPFVAEASTAIEFSFPAELGKTYRIEDSSDLAAWSTLESNIAGNGRQIQRFYSTRSVAKRYFRVQEEAQ